MKLVSICYHIGDWFYTLALSCPPVYSIKYEYLYMSGVRVWYVFGTVRYMCTKRTQCYNIIMYRFYTRSLV